MSLIERPLPFLFLLFLSYKSKKGGNDHYGKNNTCNGKREHFCKTG